MDRTAMVEEFIASQVSWLDRMSFRCYGFDYSSKSTGSDKLDPMSAQRNVVQTIHDLLVCRLKPSTAAQRVSDLILLHPNVMEAYDHMWGCLLEAVEFFPSSEMSLILADFLACLAGLPDAINQRQEPMVVISSKTTTVQPGDPIIVHWAGREERLWRDLPHFGLWLRERINGPEAYLSRGEPAETAAAIWTNINTFVATLVRDHGTEFPVLFGYLVDYAFTALADALEHPPHSRFGKNTPLHLPAACQWILLAKVEVFTAVRVGNNGNPWVAGAGQLWAREGGTNKVDGERWLFWKRRFGELREDDRLEAAMVLKSGQAEQSM